PLVLLSCIACLISHSLFSFFFTAPATTEIYTLSLHDALPILAEPAVAAAHEKPWEDAFNPSEAGILESRTRDESLDADLFLVARDRKSTRLNSSHRTISYAVFCLKKKKKKKTQQKKHRHKII